MKRAFIIILLVTIPIFLIGERNHGLLKANRRDQADKVIREQMEWQCPSIFACYGGMADYRDDRGASSVLEVDDQEVSAEAIRAFLAEYNSPLADHAEVFVSVGREYSLDPRLLVVIGCIESSCGRNYPVSTNNPFGIYSGSGGLRHFGSLGEAINYLGKLLAEASYYRVWRATEKIEDLARVYCPPYYQKWTQDYWFFMEEIGKVL